MDKSQQTDGDGMAPDEVFDLLSHHRRRAVLDILRAHDGPLALADLADEVAVREHDARLAAISAKEVKRIYLSLYHRHVAKLNNYRVINYDQERDLVALTERAEQLMTVFEVATGDD